MKTINDKDYARRIALSVLLLPLNEKSISIFSSNFQQYSDHLTNDDVYGYFGLAVNKLKPSSTASQSKNPELKEQIEELLEKFAKAHDPDGHLKLDGENLEQATEAENVAPPKTPAAGKRGRGRPSTASRLPLTDRRKTRAGKVASGEVIPKSAKKKVNVIESDDD